jgi:(p)ppGpp synthase/HD superfamily hydrolase
VRGAAALVLAAAAATGCIAHPVGPARTLEKYKGKAVTTAKSALAAVETTRLAAETAKKSFGPYVGQVVSDAEEAVTRVQGTFSSIQPPNHQADDLADQLNGILNDASNHIAAVRIAARRGELDDLKSTAAPLSDDAARLRQFSDDNK